MTEYIGHHLTHLRWPAQDGFWTLNLDTLFFTFVVCAAFLALFLGVARRAKVANPGKVQSFLEMVVVFVDGAVKETFHGKSKLIAPLSITIFGLVFFMNFLDMLPVDLLPGLWMRGHELAGHNPAHAYLRIVPTADLSTTLGMALTVFLLIQYFGLKHKGPAVFFGEMFTAPFHAHGTVGKIVLAPINFLLRLIEEAVRPVSLSHAAVRQHVRGRADLHADRADGRRGGAVAAGRAAADRACHRRHDVGHLPHPDHHPAGVHLHDADAGLCFPVFQPLE